MPKTLSVFNVTSGKRLKFRQAERLVEEDRICAWVEKPRTIRTLNLAEQIAARNEAAKNLEHVRMGYAELPELRVEGVRIDRDAIHKAWRLRLLTNIAKHVEGDPLGTAIVDERLTSLAAECAL